jgi:peroxiredoxin
MLPTLEIFNTETCDLAIDIFQEEAKQLKKETYTLTVILTTETSEHKIFTEKDGYLVVR